MATTTEETIRRIVSVSGMGVDDEKVLREDFSFAEKIGEESFARAWENVFSLAERCDGFRAWRDFVPHSWIINFFEGEKPWLTMGLICHGEVETFSVELCPKSGVHWSTHT